MAQKKRVAIFISGTGSNMVSLIKASQMIDYPAEIALVISDKSDAHGLTRAKEFSIATCFINPKDFASKEFYEKHLNNILQQNKIDFICLAGFMRLLSGFFCHLWDKKMINIHPSLLPAFKGLDTHKRAIESGVKFSGCTIHFVSPEMDGGKIIAQAVVPVYNSDTEESLAKRILKIEHQLYPNVLANLCLSENLTQADDRLSFVADNLL
jgi:phosphoribosylglycinamide formyltransferase-1